MYNKQKVQKRENTTKFESYLLITTASLITIFVADFRTRRKFLQISIIDDGTHNIAVTIILILV